jgi:hypothetical protein
VTEQLIRLALSNFTLTCLLAGLLAAGIEIVLRRKPLPRGAIAEALFAWFLFFSIGVSFLYNFVMHTFFGHMTAAFIGWAPSPFQAEVGFASLGFAIVGFLAFRGERGLRLAAVVGPAAFLWGAAAGHVDQTITAGNFAPGNAGVVFYTDILIPVIGLGLLWATRRSHGWDAGILP